MNTDPIPPADIENSDHSADTGKMVPMTPAPASTQNPTITVCDKCLQASCWQGIFMCQESGNAGTIEKTRAELEALNLESPDYWGPPQPVVSAQTPEGPWRDIQEGEVLQEGDERKLINEWQVLPSYYYGEPLWPQAVGYFRTRRPLPQPETAQPVGGTPRVDAELRRSGGTITDFARTLETELHAMTCLYQAHAEHLHAANAEVERVTKELNQIKARLAAEDAELKASIGRIQVDYMGNPVGGG